MVGTTTRTIKAIFEEDDIVNIRKWSVKNFKKYLIFYRYDDDIIEILRVIHATRDFCSTLERICKFGVKNSSIISAPIWIIESAIATAENRS
ncbi:MAG: type II toxin-antitoxin system RelE/ParE family toxin [Microcoleus sp. SU_5_3]|nr:type II toxin-antitoxin system RelE/ParE family toxin [Microcoleus sp. SU_5_3]